MKVLFICSGNSGSASIIVSRQAQYIVNQGVDVHFFLIKGKGFWGYLKNIIPLKIFLSRNNFDVIHAHYSLSAFVASLAGSKKMVVSLMGSDLKSGKFYLATIRLFALFFGWKKIIVKSQEMYDTLGISKAELIPNGVDIELFKPINRIDSLRYLGWSENIKHILFAASSHRLEKNYSLAQKAFELLDNQKFELHTLENVLSQDLPYWYSAADIVLLTSFWEGSPNVIKEAMSCSRPIVSTDVGDVRYVIGEVLGCKLCERNPLDVKNKILEVLNELGEHEKTSGRNRIISLNLDADSVSLKIIDLYKKLC